MANEGEEFPNVDFFDLLPEGCIADAVSHTSPVDACRLALVASSFRSAAESDSVWERFLPSDYQELLARSVDYGDSCRKIPPSFASKKELYLFLSDNPLIIDGGAKSFSLEKWSGKKCFMIAARELLIVWGDTPRYWRWISHVESRFADVVELVSVCWLEIRGKMNTSMLSPDTAYAAYLVFKSTPASYGFEDQPAEVFVGISGSESEPRMTMEVGAVAAMRFVRDGIRAARLVMQHTEHTMLVGDQASAFAISMGLPGPSNLSSPESLDKWIKWKENRCQPNFRKNVLPTNNCGPYHRKDHVDFGENVCLMNNLVENCRSISSHVGLHNHDTISMAVVDSMGHIAVGTSTNGASFKIPGRVGDGPIAGSSAYADDEVGACGATGDGDIMMRFLPCYQVVESMRLGMEPRVAAKDAISRIARKYPDFVGAIFAVNKNGLHAGACHGWTFQYSVRSPEMKDVEVFTVVP